ncbi:hypothetical protein BDI01nite_23500 [Brevundimonas diminuta]|nr:hypothetical protein BDI01nite_23500 [Brevundimonas diminuta]
MGWSCRVIENRDVISLGKTRRVGADGFAELAPLAAFVREDDDGGIANRASRAIAVAFDMADEFRDGSLRSCRLRGKIRLLLKEHGADDEEDHPNRGEKAAYL